MKSSNEAGKGDKQRPTNYKTFAEQMERIFGEKKCPECGKQIFSSHEHVCPKKEQS
jgi:hypothetical protein